MRLFLLSICFSFYLLAGAQNLYPLDSVTHIKLSMDRFSTYIKKGDHYFYRIIRKYDPVEIYGSEHPYKYEDLEDIKRSIVVPIDTIQSIPKEEFYRQLGGREIITYRDSASMFTVCLVSPNVLFCKWYVYEAFREHPFEVRNNWNISAMDVVELHYIALPGKRILLSGTSKASNPYFIMPTKDGIKYGNGVNLSLADTVSFSRDTNNCTACINREVMCMQAGTMNFGQVGLNKNGKYEFRTKEGEPIIKGEYDTIVRSYYYTLCKKAGRYTVYNYNLDKIEEDVRAYNFKDFYLQVVKGNDLKLIGSIGKIKGEQKIPSTFGGCGNVPYFDYCIEKKVKSLIIYTQYRSAGGKWFYYTDSASKANSMGVEDMWFLNGGKHFGVKGRGRIQDEIRINLNWILVMKGNKYGLLDYSRYPGNLIENVILDIEYDSIIASPHYNEPLKLYRNGGVYLFPLGYEQPNYQQLYMDLDFRKFVSNGYAVLGERQGNFIRYGKTSGETGWLDLAKNEEIKDN
jgi:hypothetical protein